MHFIEMFNDINIHYIKYNRVPLNYYLIRFVLPTFDTTDLIQTLFHSIIILDNNFSEL